MGSRCSIRENLLVSSPPVNITPPLTVYRRLGALLFEEAIKVTGLTPGAMGLRLREELARPTLTAPTMRAWRRGNKAVPLAAFLAVCRIAELSPGDFLAQMADGADGIEDGEVVELLKEMAKSKALTATEATR